MQRRFATGLSLLVALLALGPLATAQKPDDDQQTVAAKGAKAPLAAAIDFRKEFGLPYPSLGTLGGRIDAARRSQDAVSLAHAGSELNVAEKVSSKKASLTSSAVLKEAAQLAKLKKEAAQLQGVRQVAEQVATETDLVTELKKEIADAQKQAKIETDALRANQEPGDTPRKVLVNNYTTQYVDLWVNGNMKTQVGPGESKWFTIEHKWNPTILEGYGNEDNTHWGPRYIWGKFKTYTWNLN